MSDERLTDVSHRRGGPLEQGGFLLFLGLISVAFLIVILPFLQPVLWSALGAIMFQPLFRWFADRLPGRDTLAAFLTLLAIFVLVVIPAFAIGTQVFAEVSRLVLAFQQGQIDIAEWFRQVYGALPTRVQALLAAQGWGDFANVQRRVEVLLQNSVGLIAQQAVAIGSSVFAFALGFTVALYVIFFLLRDGRAIGGHILRSLPFERTIAEHMARHFLGIVRATVKGSVVVGLVQGLLGAITFWIVGMPSVLLLGVVMAIASFLPAVGPAIVWVPVAIYLLATGALWQGILVIVSGVALIGLVDNLLRPLLVGRDTGIPDWLVLVTTLGGIALLGFSGIIVGPLVAGLFLAAWRILDEQRGGVADTVALVEHPSTSP